MCGSPRRSGLPPVKLGIFDMEERDPAEILCAADRLCAVHRDAERDGTAGDQSAAPLERGGASHRHAFRGPLRRRDDASAARRTTGTSRTLGAAPPQTRGLNHGIRRIRPLRRDRPRPSRAPRRSHAAGTRRRLHRAHRAAQSHAQCRRLPGLRRSAQDGKEQTARRAVQRRAVPHQGHQPAREGLADDERLGLSARSRIGSRRRTRAPLSRGRRRARRQNQHAGIRHSRHDRRPASRHLPQSVESRSLLGRLVRRRRLVCRLRHGADGAWQRWAGLDPHSRPRNAASSA